MREAHTIDWAFGPLSIVLERESILEIILRAFPTGVSQSYVSIEGSTVDDNGEDLYAINISQCNPTCTSSDSDS